MLACGHEGKSFGVPMCGHLRECREPRTSYYVWYVGVGTATELICEACAGERSQTRSTEAGPVCEACFTGFVSQLGRQWKIGGQPAVCIRVEPFDLELVKTKLPTDIGKVIDVAAIDGLSGSVWLLLTNEGGLIRFDADSRVWRQLAANSLTWEPDSDPYERVFGPRLHVSSAGKFAAVVNDYGRFGRVFDLSTGKVTMLLDGGDYHGETVPFSFAFAKVNGRAVAIHRTDWNRLDISAPATGQLLTERTVRKGEPSAWEGGHYLDYFHGALSVSPNGEQIADDGWGWHPLGVVSTWSLARWATENVWESEAGPTWHEVCSRDAYWDRALCWLDDQRIAIEGIGHDESEMFDGVRIFDLSREEMFYSPWGTSWLAPVEVQAIAGRKGKFFSDGNVLFSADQAGLSRWDINDGHRTGFFPEFSPTRHHRGAKELVQLADGALIRWKIGRLR